MRGISKKSKYGCAKCEFHMECFSAFHHQDVFKVRSPAFRGALDAVYRSTTGEPTAFTRKRVSRSITSIADLKLPEA
ncbi:hypothetical protein JG687_00006534 [Phytophthora cactorum]|uniref:Uncharacterized protein n=1 Tax=Phytophthora cactorum TaxID=29920 RepID=A0A8T1UJ40_9STRA|nr:hypothetical protein JG687_00006534 [Phytophthora cactorum]